MPALKARFIGKMRQAVGLRSLQIARVPGALPRAGMKQALGLKAALEIRLPLAKCGDRWGNDTPVPGEARLEFLIRREKTETSNQFVSRCARDGRTPLVQRNETLAMTAEQVQFYLSVSIRIKGQIPSHTRP
jgi:hypothetical protein